MSEERCQSCTIGIGGIEEPLGLTDYRGYKICFWCQDQWLRREELVGQELSFREFTEGATQ